MRYLIIGNGVAGAEAATTIRKLDRDGEVVMVSAGKHPLYYRPKLIDYLAGAVDISGIVIYKEAYYHERAIELQLDVRATGIDVDAHRVFTSRGGILEYDRLLLATGADCFLPPFPGRETTGVFTVRGVADCDAIRNYVGSFQRVAVVGGGLLGLEVAYALARLGKQTTVIEHSRWLLHRQLDQEGAALLQRLLEEKGLSFITGDTVARIDSHDGRVSGVTLVSGRRLDVHAVVISAGIRGRDQLARLIGAEINRGIVVDDHMLTSIKDVYAAGDPVEHRGALYGVWPAAKEQGAVAGSAMAGKPVSYAGGGLSTNLKITGIDLYSAGDYTSPSDDLMFSMQAEIYRKYLIKDGRLAAAMVIGDAREAKLASLVYQGKAPLSELNNNIPKESPMDKYECTACGYTYDPAEGNPANGIPAGTPFDKLPEDWVCPLCGLGKDHFDKSS